MPGFIHLDEDGPNLTSFKQITEDDLSFIKTKPHSDYNFVGAAGIVLVLETQGNALSLQQHSLASPLLPLYPVLPQNTFKEIKAPKFGSTTFLRL